MLVQDFDVGRAPALQWAADLLEEDAFRFQRAEQTSSFLAAAFAGVVTVLQVRLSAGLSAAVDVPNL